jgi:hypothetical protein
MVSDPWHSDVLHVTHVLGSAADFEDWDGSHLVQSGAGAEQTKVEGFNVLPIGHTLVLGT